VRAADLPKLVEALRLPMRDFVRESRVRAALLVRGSGQVLGQHGFTRRYEIMNVASLAAAAHASSRALGHLVEAGDWAHLFHAGQERSLFLAPLRTPGEQLIVVAIFDEDSSLGVVQFFFEQLAGRIAGMSEFRVARTSADAIGFERDLNAGLDGVGAPGATEA
jgi:predicted regulator of Ras-like GTPase activity (Roadblock/LC7/MglB family)